MTSFSLFNLFNFLFPLNIIIFLLLHFWTVLQKGGRIEIVSFVEVQNILNLTKCHRSYLQIVELKNFLQENKSIWLIGAGLTEKLYLAPSVMFHRMTRKKENKNCEWVSDFGSYGNIRTEASHHLNMLTNTPLIIYKYLSFQSTRREVNTSERENV